MTTNQWKEFLTEFSRELLEVPEELHDVSAEAIETGWMGFASATEEQILTAEARIGKRLPPSLRNFYAVTNGWRDVIFYIWDILPVEQLGWLKDMYPDHVFEQKYIDMDLKRARDKQDEELIHEQYTYVNRSIVVSGYGDAGFWLLDPEFQNENGEWRGGHTASWKPGTDWHASSFAELMQKARETRKQLQ